MQALTEAYSELGFVKQSLDGSSPMVTFQRAADGYEMFHHVPEGGIDLQLLLSDAMIGLDDGALVTRFCHELVLAMLYPPEKH